MRDAPREPEPETLELIFQETRGALAKQFEQIQILNSRAQQLLGFGGLVLGLLIGFRPPTLASKYVTLSSLGGLALFLAVLLSGGLAWSIVGWRGDPRPRQLWTRYRLWPEGWLRQQLILNWLDALDANQAAIDAKLRYVRLTQGLLGFEVVYLVAIVILRPYLA
jgi:hypothetical protein